MSASEQTNTSVLIGVDTGGTYTDAVLVDSHSHRVLSSAKALTTPDDLAVGVSQALESISTHLSGLDVSFVSVSTTLATNAVVEGTGSPVLVLLAGFDEKMIERTGIVDSFPDAQIHRVPGGHDHHGAEREALDLDAVRHGVQDATNVNAVAVASAFAVRNPAHEHAIRDLVLAETSLPVTISSELSAALDAPRRALTTTLNARLLSRISDLVTAVETSTRELGIDAPILIAKGDGSLASAQLVRRRPIETVLSGPAASLVGAGALCGLDNFILSDVGGTTTDVGRVVDGRLRLSSDGARIGAWRTMVEAIDIRTTGLGGDSASRQEDASLRLGPERRVPVSLVGVDHPQVLSDLKGQLADPPPRDVAGVFVWSPSGHDGEGAQHSGVEQRILERLSAGKPVALAEVSSGAVDRRALDALSARGVVRFGGFTPSDAAHVLGQQSQWNAEVALAAAELHGWYAGENAIQFAHRVRSEMIARSGACVLAAAFGDDTIGPSNPLVNAVLSGQSMIGAVEVGLTLNTAVVAVGGPAGVFYPDVAQRIGAQMVIPDEFAVANAVGAAVGHVVARAITEIHTDGPGAYRMITGAGTEVFDDVDAAVSTAVETARSEARDRLMDRTPTGVTLAEPIEHLDIERHDDPNAKDGDGLYRATVRVELRARPVRLS